jgi:glycosyltransferase involved in cell wall biosynthesis
LFSDKDVVKHKFAHTEPLRVLFLSNLLYGKGHVELVAAYKNLAPEFRERLKIDIAGGFEWESERSEFLESIQGLSGITFHGHVVGQKKKELYHDAHIFCLPTYYPWEGQPFSILEAYAAGCVVITTNHSGISQVFSGEENGFQVEKQSVSSLQLALEKALTDPTCLLDIGLNNLTTARRQYTTDIFKKSMLAVFDSIAMHR